MGYLELTFALFLSALLGSVIGIQRQRIGKAAGMRTFALVSLGSMVFTMISRQAFEFGDPGRVAAQVVTGIGFICAGAILHKGDSIEGLTTAAGMWVSAAIGMAVGVGLYFQSILVAVVVIVVLIFQNNKFLDKK